MRDDLDLATYRLRLTQFDGFYRPLESFLFDSGVCDWARFGLQPDERRKSGWLARDLACLGADDVRATASAAELPRIDSPEQAFGCLYVLEGATLGGRVISRHLRNTLGLEPETGARFHYGYGERGPLMWQTFGSSLNQFATGPADERRILGGACATFESLARWCRT